jgi:6-pyruvoyltetrahydropterin/6-carboxytetrahydropterin synthase
VFTISKLFHVTGVAHHLDRLPPDHQCARNHGHNYDIEVVLRARDANVLAHEYLWVRDYGDLAPLKDFLAQYFDHRDLNETLTPDVVIPISSQVEFTPTAEMIALLLYRWCKDRWPETCAVRVSETPGLWAEYHE